MCYLFFTLKRLQPSWINLIRQTSNILNCLPTGHNPNVLHRHQSIEERFEPDFVVRLGEPCCMVEQSEWRPASSKYLYSDSFIFYCFLSWTKLNWVQS